MSRPPTASQPARQAPSGSDGHGSKRRARVLTTERERAASGNGVAVDPRSEVNARLDRPIRVLLADSHQLLAVLDSVNRPSGESGCPQLAGIVASFSTGELRFNPAVLVGLGSATHPGGAGGPASVCRPAVLVGLGSAVRPRRYRQSAGHRRACSGARGPAIRVRMGTAASMGPAECLGLGRIGHLHGGIRLLGHSRTDATVRHRQRSLRTVPSRPPVRE